MFSVAAAYLCTRQEDKPSLPAVSKNGKRIITEQCEDGHADILFRKRYHQHLPGVLRASRTAHGRTLAQLSRTHHGAGERRDTDTPLPDWRQRAALQDSLQHRALRHPAVEQRQDSGVLEVLAQAGHTRDLPHPQARESEDFRLLPDVEVNLSPHFCHPERSEGSRLRLGGCLRDSSLHFVPF